eukprot:TRINITY_DN8286_c0_g1_i3.p1 TRINITY_DN8286_c0_g1~~TRINITY_DN8286_c0_g1_i3.p1  ORF type:complete len:276 (-),score=35.79 TRINITY_DN8286_c0_g1_i3:263-1090(-)
MNAIAHVLCKGNQDFVFGVQGATDLLYVATTQAFNATDSRLKEESYRSLAVQGIVEVAEPSNVSGASFTDNMAVFESKMAESMGEYATMWSLCADFQEPLGGNIARALRFQTGVEGATMCHHLKEHCFDLEQRFLRLICPVTCGCASPRSGLYLTTHFDGCPLTCKTSPQYEKELQALPCEDASAAELASSESWQAYFDQFEDFWSANFPDWKDYTTAIARNYREKGCEAVAADTTDNLCVEGLKFSSIRPWCPVTCGCGTTGDSRNCPPRCSAP